MAHHRGFEPRLCSFGDCSATVTLVIHKMAELEGNRTLANRSTGDRSSIKL